MNFLDEMGIDWEFASAEYELMRAELERDRVAISDFQLEAIREVGVPIQNLHPKKTEKVNWQKEGF